MNTLIKVSIVEDDHAVREIFADWVGHADGFRCVSTYANGERAVADLPRVRSNIVLMDINLPQMNGVECVRRLKPLLPATQFVMVTVYEDADHIFDALAAGAVGYLLKRTPRKQLLAALREVNAGGSPMSTNIARMVVESFGQPRQIVSPEMQGLSPREQEVLELLARGYLYKEIAEALKISPLTVPSFVRRIYDKLHVHSRAQAVAKVAHWTTR
ncbi:MAG: response regulator transcription factor [Verrucomicrobia bacterium]|nr:response regulator transcription factor [Verrucomicrobiota bacterium]OQC26096.1 MAG: Transcriptional regulatory protein DegU [Verrucomicrobia bacterium ADurb.Bin063]HNW08895.1 response regulator transcription factor [Verrucomicrobiota bacterium]HNZ75146.1 response regulator transcription factor [Verrucomicrobiota bacterium]HOC52059.1 response regulator transcription factor [Verrucomicrobiota bacterium]